MAYPNTVEIWSELRGTAYVYVVWKRASTCEGWIRMGTFVDHADAERFAATLRPCAA